MENRELMEQMFPQNKGKDVLDYSPRQVRMVMSFRNDQSAFNRRFQEEYNKQAKN